MAAVWLAVDNTLQREVAIKFLWERDNRRRREHVKSFLREARLAASVVHQNVVQILDFGLHDDDTPYMVMEALVGRTLGEHFDAGAQFTVREVMQLGSRSLEGLIAVHEAGIVHRDLKPENVFITEQRGGLYPKLLDFGISRSLDPSSGRRSAVTTVAGRVIGTPEYMSSEQANGSADITRRSDVYAMGVILYETIVGDVPYRSEHVGDLLLQITGGDAPSVASLVPEIGRPISEVIEVAMRLQPEARYADAGEMFEAWEAAVEATKRGVAHPFGALPNRVPGRRERNGPRSVTTMGEEEIEELTTPPRESAVALHSVSLTGRWAGAVPRWLWVAAAGSLATVALIAFALARVSTAPAEPARFIVVQGTKEAGAEPIVETGPLTDVAAVDGPARREPSSAASAPVSAKPAPSSVKERKSVTRRRRTPARAKPVAKSDPEVQVAQAFLRQKKGVVRCLERHPNKQLPRLSVRMRVDERGRVEEVAVLPTTIGRTSVGNCIEQAVSVMRFTPQTQAATYRVPLVARRGS